MNTFLQDVRYAVRGLLKAPGFTALAAVTLALGIGANTAIFSVVRGVVLKPLPYERPDEIVRLWPQRIFSKEMVAAFETRAESFSAVSGYRGATFSLTGGGEPESLAGTAVATAHFSVIGARPALGRSFEIEDRAPGSKPVVVLSHGLWQRRFGSDPKIVGSEVSLEGLGASSRTVIGVMPAGFRPLAAGSQLWVPLVFDPGNPDDYRDMIFLRALARLAPGVTVEQAGAEVGTIARQLREENPGRYGEENVRTAGVARLHEIMIGGIRSNLWVLVAAVGFVLLIGCSNIANMLLARAGSRRREMAVRAALGAGRGRLLRQLLTESALLGILGGAAGVLAAVWLESFLVTSLPSRVPRTGEIGIDLAELGFAAALSLLAVLVFGLVPALRSTRSELRSSLRDGGFRSSAGPRGQRLNQTLVAAEIALSVVLVAGAGLMLKSLWRLHQVEPGFETEKRLAFKLTPSADRYGDAERLGAYYDRILEGIEALPGVSSASAINLLPMSPGGLGVGYSAEDHPADSEAPSPTVSLRSVTPDYFRTMGIPLVSGRVLSDADRDGAAEVGLINETMARELWPAESAIGKKILWDDGSPWFTVVGVVGDVRQHRLDRAPRTEVYRPSSQAFDETTSAMFIAVHTEGAPSALVPAIRRAVWSIDGDVPISRLGSMDEVIGAKHASSRFFTLLLAAFGALALILGAIGVYGVGSYAVSQRTREIGVRMALGARRETMLRSVMAREMVPVALGVAAGVVAALGATRVLASSLFGVAATDPATYLAVALVLGTVATAASYLPARRAAAVDPIVALRSE